MQRWCWLSVGLPRKASRTEERGRAALYGKRYGGLSAQAVGVVDALVDVWYLDCLLPSVSAVGNHFHAVFASSLAATVVVVFWPRSVGVES